MSDRDVRLIAGILSFVPATFVAVMLTASWSYAGVPKSALDWAFCVAAHVLAVGTLGVGHVLIKAVFESDESKRC